MAQHRNAVCLFALRTWQSRRASGCSVTPESPVVQGSACGRLHCANTSGSTNCRQRLLSLSERRHGIAIGAGLHALVPVDAGATEVSAEASRGNARCKPQALRIRCSETADIPAHLCRHRLRFLGFAHPKQAVGRAESTLLACAGAAHERTALPLAPSTGEDVRRVFGQGMGTGVLKRLRVYFGALLNTLAQKRDTTLGTTCSSRRFAGALACS